MARIKKYAPTLNEKLTTFQTFIVDTNPNSNYFRISEFKEVLTGGKNGFQIEGSEHLLESTEIKIEILDVEGNTVYYEPGDGIPEYYEGISKIVSVHVYEDTPIGEATVTILGELKTYVDDDGVVKDVPTEWKGIYNCKWERKIKINKFLSNEDKVRFYRRPKVSITEIVKPLFSNVVSSKTNTGTVSGIPLSPIDGTNLNQYTLPTSYLLKITDTGNFSAWTGSVIGNEISIPSLGYTTTAQEIINKTELVVTTPYTQDGLVSSFANAPYTTTFNYTEGVDNLATALTGSFAKINLTDLTSFVGDVARVRVFRKSQSDLSDYQFVQEIQLEANELLVDLTTTDKNQENYGIFTTDIINNYWIESSPNITATYNQTYLYDSVKLDSVLGPNSFYTSEYIPITKDVEYTLDFNIRLGSNVSSNNYVRVFLSGSLNGGAVQIEQDITTITSSDLLLQKTTSTDNIKAQEIENARLYFEVVGSNWYIANVSFRASKETAFSPDEITFIQPVPRSLPVQTFIYKFEFYDINNNFIPVLVEKEKTFNGGNLQTIQKSLQLIPSSLYFQFDSGSNPVPPTTINIQVIKTLLTGSVHYTSQSIDFDGHTHTTAEYNGGQYPGVLNQSNPDNLILTVQNFTGSRSDRNVQYLEITGEVEGYTDTVVITKVLDGFGGVNHIIRPFRGTQIRNSSTASLEIQAVRIDGINEISLNNTAQPLKGWNKYQLHILSQSGQFEYFINLQKAVSQNYIKGLSVGELGTKELNYNAIFNRDSINKTRVVYLIQSSSAVTGQPAYIASASVLASITLEDLQDGLDTGFMAYNTDAFTINPRTQTIFTPVSASVTGSFYKRGTNVEPFTASFEVFPSMSLNLDYEPEYWMYYVTGKFHPNISVVAIDEKKRTIPSQPASNTTVRLPISQSKTLTVTLTYTEDYTSSSISLDKTFTIVPQGKPGDESIVFEVTPANVNLNANSEGTVLDYKPSITDIKLKQGSRYLVFTGSRDAGTFHIATSSISSQNITPGNVHFTSSFGVAYTASLIVSQSSNFTQLSGSITYPLIIHPYYTSSIYTQSIVQNYTKAVDGPPPIDVIITPSNINLNADENGFISTYAAARTTIQLREGNKFLTFNSNSAETPGTFKFGTTPTQNITISTLQGNGTNAVTASFSLFNYPHVSASVIYNIIAYPYSLGPGHRFTSSVFNRTQNITKNVASSAARSVKLAASSYTVTYDSDGQVVNPTDGITLVATSFNTTGSKNYQFFKDDVSQGPITTTGTRTIGPEDAVAPGEIATWKVTLRDGSNSASAPIRAQDSITITGIQEGIKAYNTYLTNENASIVYTVQGTLSLQNTGTTIVATKGNTALTAKTTFSAQSQDPFGNNIGSLGEYKVTIHSKSAHITLAGSLVSGSTVPVVGTQATIGNVIGWVAPTTNLTAAVVYRIDFENNKQVLFKTQSLAIQLEGRYGPGIVFRGPWSANIDQYYFDPSIGRRDAVLYGGTGGTYYAAKSGSGDTTYVNPNTSQYFSGSLANANAGGYTTFINYKTPGVDTDYWEALGTQELFVAAKIAIFEESYVQNTINVGTNALGSAANIILYGNVDRPYISIGQTGTIGYGQTGIWLGTYGSPSVVARMSLVNSGDTNHMTWDGTSLDVKGTINATAGNFSGYVTIGGALIGAGVSGGGSNNGIYINSNNYWYDNGNFSVGNGSSGATWNGSAFSVTGDITATSGYISSLFTVGSNAASRIFLDAQTSTRKIYIGAGNFDNNDTTFYVDTTGKFSLGNRFKYETTTSGFGSYITANSIMYVRDIRADQVSFDFHLPSPDGDGYGMFVSSGYVLGGGGGYNAQIDFIGTSANASFGKTGTFSIGDVYITGGSITGVSSVNVSGTLTATGLDINGAGDVSTTLYVGGILTGGSSATFTGDVTANTSDKRLKTNVRKIDNALEKVSQINGVYYNFTDKALELNHTLDKEEQVGLLAQEVQSVLPHIIKPAPFDIDRESGESISGENYLTIQYEKIVPLLLEAIKELKAEVEELKKNK